MRSQHFHLDNWISNCNRYKIMIKNLHSFISTEKDHTCGRVKHLFIRLWLWCLIPLSTIFQLYGGSRVAQWVTSLDLTAHISLSPIRRGFAPSFVNYQKGCTRLAAASDKVYQLLTLVWWFFPGTPASFTTKTGRHDIAEIFLKVALSTKNSNSIVWWRLILLTEGNLSTQRKPLTRRVWRYQRDNQSQ
jgi:hypothetical protein